MPARALFFQHMFKLRVFTRHIINRYALNTEIQPSAPDGRGSSFIWMRSCLLLDSSKFVWLFTRGLYGHMPYIQQLSCSLTSCRVARKSVQCKATVNAHGLQTATLHDRMQSASWTHNIRAFCSLWPMSWRQCAHSFISFDHRTAIQKVSAQSTVCLYETLQWGARRRWGPREWGEGGRRETN